MIPGIAAVRSVFCRHWHCLLAPCRAAGSLLPARGEPYRSQPHLRPPQQRTCIPPATPFPSLRQPARGPCSPAPSPRHQALPPTCKRAVHVAGRACVQTSLWAVQECQCLPQLRAITKEALCRSETAAAAADWTARCRRRLNATQHTQAPPAHDHPVSSPAQHPGCLPGCRPGSAGCLLTAWAGRRCVGRTRGRPR